MFNGSRICVSFLLLMALAASAQEPTDGGPNDRRRRVKLEGQPNCRDLGGYKTLDGRSVKWGQLYRSGELPKLTDADLQKLQKLHWKIVVNFLTDAEVKHHGADRLPPGAKLVRRPIESDIGDLAQTILEARKNADFSSVPPDLNPKIHQLLVRDKNARKEYANLLRLAADPKNRPLAFHCSHGVHRTGTGAAILLWSLGVPWETVREDYLLSNAYRKAATQRRLQQFREQAAKRQGVAEDAVDMTNFEAFYVLQGNYIDASRDTILKDYGSLDRYLTEGLGLKSQEIKLLRDQLLH